MVDSNSEFTKSKIRNKQIIAEEISNELFDKDFTSRYGTSLTSNMGREFLERLEIKYDILEKEFSTINKDQNEVIDISELKDFVKSYEGETGVILPDDYCEKFFKLVDMDHSGTISIQEFIKGYMLLEERLKLKKLKLTKLTEEIQNAIQKANAEREKYKNEPMNRNGVSENAHLNLTLLEARDLRPMDFNGKSDPYCIFTLDGKYKQTSTYKPETLNPVWNEEFNL